MLIIDRIENGIAVIETESGHIDVPREMLASDAREGDIVVLRDGMYVPDKAAAEKRRREITELQDSLWDS